MRCRRGKLSTGKSTTNSSRKRMNWVSPNLMEQWLPTPANCKWTDWIIRAWRRPPLSREWDLVFVQVLNVRNVFLSLDGIGAIWNSRAASTERDFTAPVFDVHHSHAKIHENPVLDQPVLLDVTGVLLALFHRFRRRGRVRWRSKGCTSSWADSWLMTCHYIWIAMITGSCGHCGAWDLRGRSSIRLLGYGHVFLVLFLLLVRHREASQEIQVWP